MHFVLKPGQLTYQDIKKILASDIRLELDSESVQRIQKSSEVIQNIIKENKVVYGINTGFGALANTRINNEDLEALQERLVLSHAAGTGPYLEQEVVKLILLLKINSLARGYSGIRLETVKALIALFNHQVYPCIPAQGSVGASGDLAPLAHLSAVLLGVGEVIMNDEIISAKEGLRKIGLAPLKLAPKEGLALLNGTQTSTALAIIALMRAEILFFSAIAAGALSVDAARGSDIPFDERIQAVRGHQGQIEAAAMLRALLKDSEIRESHLGCEKIQDPYSLRCQPQVMGSCWTQLRYTAEVLLTEANAVSDNPLVFTEEGCVLSGGNFHAEPVALASDAIAVAVAEIGALSERRIALLMDPTFSRLPPFLVENAGVNSGFMIAQVTAAALASENKSLAHPASVDSLPTSANQEDHVSMATFAAKRLLQMCENTAGIIAIEMLAAAQGIDFLKPLKTSPALMELCKALRAHVDFYKEDRFFAPDIAAAKSCLWDETFYPTILESYGILK